MTWLLLIASLAFGQEEFRPERRIDNTYQLLMEMRSGVPVLTSSPSYKGKPTYENGIIFGDGTEQTTAATSSIYSATNTYVGTTSGTSDRTGTLSLFAKSVDGISQSSGCLVILKTDSEGPSGVAVFTSTTTSSATGFQTVLLDDCDPGEYCRVAIAGLVRVYVASGASTIGGPLAASTTRCKAQNGSGGQGTGSSGRFIMAGDGATAWAVVTPG